MATQYGISQAWKSVHSQLPSEFSECASPEALRALMSVQTESRPRWRSDAERVVAQSLAGLQKRLAPLREAVSSTRLEATAKAASEITRLTALRRNLEAPSFVLIRWYNRWIRIPSVNKRLAWLDGAADRASEHLVRELNAVAGRVASLQTHPDAEITRIVQQWETRLRSLETAAASPAFAGAIAELEMVRLLNSGLSDEYVIFNDVKIDIGRWIHADGQHRRTAQIDHVVVGPGGVFALEVKLWSQAFANRGDYHDPFLQVKWAAKLCYFALSDSIGQPVRVREVIASAGGLPPKPADSYAKVLRPDEVCGYIRYFGNAISPHAVREITYVLRRHIG
jgi:hypothetical protein